jgi:hypothetical protein
LKPKRKYFGGEESDIGEMPTDDVAKLNQWLKNARSGERATNAIFKGRTRQKHKMEGKTRKERSRIRRSSGKTAVKKEAEGEDRRIAKRRRKARQQLRKRITGARWQKKRRKRTKTAYDNSSKHQQSRIETKKIRFCFKWLGVQLRINALLKSTHLVCQPKNSVK